MPSMRSKMTAAALALATTAALSLVGAQHARADDFDSGNPQPTTQQQQANPARGLKDAVGGLFGAIVGNKLGHGSTFGTLAGGVVGVVATDKFQERNDLHAPAKPGERGFLPSGPQPMDPDKHARLVAQEQGFLRSRDAYAAALLNNEKVLEDVMLSPHDPATHARGVAAKNALDGAQAQYMQQRTDFVKAAEFFGEHGYNVSEFAYSHKIAFNDLTARDVLRKDLAAVNANNQKTVSGQSLQASP